MSLSLQLVGSNFTLREKDFFENISKQIQKGEKAIQWQSRKKYRVEVSKRALDFVLQLIDLQTGKEVEELRIKQNQELMALEATLLTDLARAIEQTVTQGALDIQRDYKDAVELAKRIDPADQEFIDFIKDVRDISLNNLRDVARRRGREPS